MRQSSLKIHDKVLVVGSGIIALIIGELAKKACASCLVMSKIDERQTAKAREIGEFDMVFEALERGLLERTLKWRRLTGD